MRETETRSQLLPTDEYSLELRKLRNDPGALSSQSTIDSQDIYGNASTWIVETYRDEEGRERVFVQLNNAQGGQRWVLPPEVTAALARHRDQLSAKGKRRQGHRLIALRKGRGDVLGNPEALKKARKGRRA